MSFLILACAGALAFVKYWRELLANEEGMVERSKIAWKFLVPAYSFFATLAAGAAIAAGLAGLGVIRAEPQPLAFLALASLVPAWALVVADLGAPERAINILTSFNKTSRIAWNVAFYVLLALSILWLLLAPSPEAALLAIASAILLETNFGMAFGTSKVPGWQGSAKAAEFAAATFLAMGIWLTRGDIILVSVISLLLLDFWELYFVKSFERLEVPLKYVAPYYALLALAAVVSLANPVAGAALAFIGLFANKALSAEWPQRLRLSLPPYSYAFSQEAAFVERPEVMVTLAAFLIWIALLLLKVLIYG